MSAHWWRGSEFITNIKSWTQRPHRPDEQMSGPDLHVFTLKFSALEKTGFPPLKILPKMFLTFLYLYSMQLVSADPKIFSKKF